MKAVGLVLIGLVAASLAVPLVRAQDSAPAAKAEDAKPREAGTFPMYPSKIAVDHGAILTLNADGTCHGDVDAFAKELGTTTVTPLSASLGPVIWLLLRDVKRNGGCAP